MATGIMSDELATACKSLATTIYAMVENVKQTKIQQPSQFKQLDPVTKILLDHILQSNKPTIANPNNMAGLATMQTSINQPSGPARFMGKCFNCRKQGHRAKVCRFPRRPHHLQQSNQENLIGLQ